MNIVEAVELQKDLNIKIGVEMTYSPTREGTLMAKKETVSKNLLKRKLLPCPCCNGIARMVDGAMNSHMVKCEDCGQSTAWHDTEFLAQEYWNKRYAGTPFHHRKKERQELVDFARRMRLEGYSFRQIMKMMGYKSTSSIEQLLNRAQ